MKKSVLFTVIGLGITALSFTLANQSSKKDEALMKKANAGNTVANPAPSAETPAGGFLSDSFQK